MAPPLDAMLFRMCGVCLHEIQLLHDKVRVLEGQVVTTPHQAAICRGEHHGFDPRATLLQDCLVRDPTLRELLVDGLLQPSGCKKTFGLLKMSELLQRAVAQGMSWGWVRWQDTSKVNRRP